MNLMPASAAFIQTARGTTFRLLQEQDSDSLRQYTDKLVPKPILVAVCMLISDILPALPESGSHV